MGSLKYIGKIEFEYSDKYFYEYYWRDDIDGQIYVNNEVLEDENFSIPKPAGVILNNLQNGFDVKASLEHDVVSPKSNYNGYLEHILYYTIEELNLNAQGYASVGLNTDEGVPRKEVFLNVKTMLEEALKNERTS